CRSGCITAPICHCASGRLLNVSFDSCLPRYLRSYFVLGDTTNQRDRYSFGPRGLAERYTPVDHYSRSEARPGRVACRSDCGVRADASFVQPGVWHKHDRSSDIFRDRSPVNDDCAGCLLYSGEASDKGGPRHSLTIRIAVSESPSTQKTSSEN